MMSMWYTPSGMSTRRRVLTCADPSAWVEIALYGPRPPTSEFGVMSPHGPGRMAHGTCALFGPKRMSIDTVYELASSGASVIVPDMRLDVVPVEASVVMYWRRAVAGAPAGVGEAVVVEELDDPDAHAAASARAKSGKERM